LGSYFGNGGEKTALNGKGFPFCLDAVDIGAMTAIKLANL
jgi:hypothetical protein